MMVPLAQTMLATEPDSALGETIELLNQSVAARYGGSPLAWRLLATAYGRSGDIGMAAVALAEEALARGDRATARQQSERALQDPPGRLRRMVAGAGRPAGGGRHLILAGFTGYQPDAGQLIVTKAARNLASTAACRHFWCRCAAMTNRNA